jgi:dUTP pyrophosphatase
MSTKLNPIAPQIIYVDERARDKQLMAGSADAAGLDICIFPRDEDGIPLDRITLDSGETRLVHTGIRVWIGAGGGDIFGMVVPRSSVGHKLNIMLGNTTGIIDSDYQGEILLSLHNRSDRTSRTIEAGERMAQMIFLPYLRATGIEVVTEFDSSTARGEGGYGSTGR